MMLRWAIALVIVCWASCSVLLGQTGKDTDLWQWTQQAPHHDSIVQITSAGGTGTGVVISIDKSAPVADGFKGYCLTAYHVVQDDQSKGEIALLYRNGRKAKNCRVVCFDESADVALLWVWVPEGIEAAKLASDPVRNGDTLEFAGLGGGSNLSCCLRHFSAVASRPSSEHKIFSDVPLLPGDSGGPVFNAQNEVVGVISGGWFWWDGGVKTETGSTLNATWPARAANVGPIQQLLHKAELSQQVLAELPNKTVR